MKETIQNKLVKYKKRYYLNLLIKGSIITLTVLLSVFLFLAFIEYYLHSGRVVRGILFFAYLVLAFVVLYQWLFIHLFHIGFKSKQISDETAAKNIGGFFPNIHDKLLNLIQLQKLNYTDNALVAASIAQRSEQMVEVPFGEAVRFKENVRYLRYLFIPFIVVAILGLFSPNVLTESSTRLMHFNREYIPQAPFQFVIENKEMLAFKNEDFTVQVSLEGSAIPENVYLITSGRKVKMSKGDQAHFQHNFEKIQHSSTFFFESAGFRSQEYNIRVVNRPNIKNFDLTLNFPSYLNKDLERINNIGNVRVPEGTEIQWIFQTIETENFEIIFGDPEVKETLQGHDNQLFEYKKSFFKPTDYYLKLKNQYSENKDLIRYNIEVVPDEFPKISLEHFGDTIMYEFLILGGNISDDYGLTDLRIHYNISRDATSKDEQFQSINIPIDRASNSQSYYYQWQLNDLSLGLGEKVDYYVEVKDNDGINGRKATRTGLYTFKVPSKREIAEELKISTQNTENQIDNSLKESKELNEKLNEIENKLKGQKELSWQDRKMLEDLMRQKEALNEALQKLKEQFDADDLKRDKLNKEKNSELQEKVRQLQELMEELLDDETKKLYDELQKLLEEQKDLDQIKDMLNKLNFKEDNLEKELERTLELFKKMKFEQMLQQNINETKDLGKKQEELSKETDQKESGKEELLQEQEKLTEEFEQLKEDIQEMQEMNQELRHPAPMQDLSEQEKAVDEQQKEAQEMLKENKKRKAGAAQQNAAEQMKKMAEKMESMQTAMMQSSLNLNLAHLRDLVDNLVKLSFAQEKLMKEFRSVNQSDPRFLELSKKQLDLKDDAKVIQDSLFSLAKQDFRIEAFVTREVGEMNRYLDESVEAIKERKQGEAVGYQQFAMTSINNLALMLDDVMTQMMNAMSSGGGQQQNQPVPSLSELQQQLNEQINELKKSGKQGRELSEELARMAAEQEKIRRMIEELEEELNQQNQGQGDGGSLDELQKKMEQTEWDLVNKRITQQLIQRQQEIMTRLLEAEDSMRERDLDEEREGEHAKDFVRTIPRAFEEYIRMKEREIELLKTIPPRLNPYYKKEVNEYFKRIGNF